MRPLAAEEFLVKSNFLKESLKFPIHILLLFLTFILFQEEKHFQYRGYQAFSGKKGISPRSHLLQNVSFCGVATKIAVKL